MRSKKWQTRHRILLFTLFLVSSSVCAAQDQTGSGRRQDAILIPDNHPSAAHTHRIFNQLLKLWPGPRLKPTLRVIDKPDLWAVSLADGIIQISRGAVELALADGGTRADVQLAFVLAHEIAHQRADHMSQHAFFSRNTPGKKHIAGWAPYAADEKELEAMEQQADAEGLLLAALAGFDPLIMLGENDFFTTWVERVRAAPCDTADPAVTAPNPCAQANQRARFARDRLRQLATQTLLFELGIQAYVADAQDLARYYFEAFGRVAPSTAVHTNMGLAHLAEAMTLSRNTARPAHDATFLRYAFQYPIRLVDAPLPTPQRGKLPKLTPERLAKISQHLDAALLAFEHALQLNPDDPQSYIHTIVVYLVQGNVAMARGLLDGKIEPRFGNPPVAQLLRGILLAMEGKLPAAQDELVLARDRALSIAQDGSASEDHIAYTANVNLELLSIRLNNRESALAARQSFIDAAQRHGRHLLVSMATSSGESKASARPSLRTIATGRGFIIDKPITDRIRRNPLLRQTALNVLDQPYTALRYDDGTGALVDTRLHPVATWQVISYQDIPVMTNVTQALSLFGAPDRQVITEAGVYWAYDRAQCGLRIVNDRVVSLFQYPSVRPLN